ncbi:MAG: hypothetical protein IPP83_14210 [Flavobacteriales bacterium]|nr:hypothetical protein [Flavobacteriales bacterium]
MTAAVFEARYHRILRSREQGYEELSDFLGRHADIGPLVRSGLLYRREENSEFQRYHGYVPTPAAEDRLLYIQEKELILVKPGQSAALISALKKDPSPKSAFKPTFAEPTLEQFAAWRSARDQAGRDVWRTQRCEHWHQALLSGFMDIRSFTKRTGIGEGGLLRLELCKPRMDRAHEQALSMEPTKEGAQYLTVLDPWELLLIKPGMELPLYERCEPEQAAYWIGLP